MPDEELPSLEDGQGDEAAEAFALLTREVREMEAQLTIIRKGTEAAFDKLDSLQAPPDYAADIADLSERTTTLTKAMKAFGELSALKYGPEHYAHILERSGESLVKTAAHELENKTRDLERVGRNLDMRLAGARERGIQNRWLWGAGCAGLVLGIVLTLFLPAALPFQAAPRLASVIMGERPWDAGMSLMAFDSPQTWEHVATASQLVEANRQAVESCREAANSSGSAEECTITVAPAR